MMDCKKALKESKGDMELAIDYLRKKGIATAKKRGGRATYEGQVCLLHPHGSQDRSSCGSELRDRFLR